MEKIIIIAGPTASGKTKFAIDLAKKINAEIISADSRQIFREVSIGTAKPTSQELHDSKILHYGFDLVSLKDDFNVAKFLEFFNKTAEKILKKSKKVILCGGTGLYIDACLNGLSEIPEINPEIREKTKKILEEKGLDFVYEELKKADETIQIDRKNPHRLIRAYEVLLGTGKSLSYWHKIDKKNKQNKNFEFDLVVLDVDRQELYENIDKRVDKMFQEGLLDEVKYLMDNFSQQEIKKAGIGYENVVEFIEGKTSLDEAKEKMKQETRKFAKRQITWFRKYDFAKWIKIKDMKKIAKNNF